MKTTPLFDLKKNPTNFEEKKIMSPNEAYHYIKQFYGDDIEVYESVFILLLNQSGYTVGYAKISQGGIVGTVVDVRLVAKYAIESLCSSVIMAHNHPSGNTRPSEADEKITKKVKESLNLFDIRLSDHIILTKDNYTSMADEGYI